VCLSEFLNGLGLQLNPVCPTRGGAQTDILRFTMAIFVYKWLLLVIGEIISRNYYLFIIRIAIGYSGRSGTSMHQI